ncbi:MAG: ABC transporter ATP-binding protein/permease [Clostridia bacterium]|nr:ABC transporter ATP-binding protein/permease [Clostridia bacterium]
MKRLQIIDWLVFLLGVGFIVLQVWLDLKTVDYTRTILLLIQNGSTINTILIQGGYMLACSLVSLLGAVFCGYCFSLISARFARNIRRELFLKVQNLSMADVKKFSVSSLITRTTNDISQVQTLIAVGLQMIIKAPITAIWAISKIANKSWEWTTLTTGSIIIILVGVAIIMSLVLPKFKKVQTYIDDLNNVTEEQLSGIRVVHAFNAEAYQETKFEEKNQILTKTLIFNQRTMGFLNPLMYLVMNLMSLGIYWLGAFLINGADVSKDVLFADMGTFNGYASQVVSSFLMLVMIFIMWPRASVSAGRINQVLGTKNSIIDGTFVGDTNLKGVIEFRNVSFKYPDSEELMLKNISFKTKMGDTLAIIGSTGAGKTTAVNLMMRFYDCTSGEILIDGIKIKDYSLETLYNKIGYVSQRAVLFSGTVSENIDFGTNGKDKITEEKIKQAVAVAQSTDFVEAMENNYQGNVAQGGTNLSGGQKQRLSIARAVARNPEIYIFDDSFSALDYVTDYKLRTELKKYTKEATNIIVAQRIGTIMNADTIIVLEKGECVGIGTHKELLKNCKTYKEIAYSQLSKEELNG